MKPTRFELDAIDVEVRDAEEVRRFRAQLETPAETDPKSPFKIVILAVGFVLGVLLAGVVGTIAQIFGHVMIDVHTLIAFLIGMLAPLAYVVWRQQIKPLLSAHKRDVRGKFRVSFDPSVMTIAWAKRSTVIDVADIERFESTRTGVAVVRRNGTKVGLPCAMPTVQGNEALAVRFSDALHEARTAGGYRGVEPIDEPIMPEDQEHEHEHERAGKA